MISITQLLSYGSALAIAAIIPGPGMTAVVARTLNGGVVMGFALLSGLILGIFFIFRLRYLAWFWSQII